MFAPGHIRRRNRRRLAGGAGTYAADFDQASAAAIDPAGARLTPVKHWNTQWAWWAVRHPDLFTQPAFAIAKASHYNAVSGMWLACWAAAADTDTWNQLTATIGASDITFSPAAAFPGGPIYLAALPMYPFSRVQRKVAAWAANALVGETASSTAKSLGSATARDAGDGSGRSAPALPFYALQVANATANTKNKAILSAFNHPSETPGAFQLEGALDWLLTTSPEQKFLLDWFTFSVYPCLNPQGVWSGYFRSSPQTPTSDNNRLWDTTGTNEAVDAFKTAMDADTAGAIEVGIDFHSWMEAFGPKSGGEDNAAALYAAWLAQMQTLDGTYAMLTADNTASMLRYWFQHTLGAKLSINSEYGHVATAGVADWKANGANVMRSLVKMLAAGQWTQGPGVGSRSFNGTTDRIDFASAANLSGAPVTVSAWIYLGTLSATAYVLCNHDAGDSNYGLNFCCYTGNYFGLLRRGAGDFYGIAANSTLSTGVWTHILATHPGTNLSDYNTVKLYKNGVEVSYQPGANSSSETAHTGKWSLGGRIYSDTRNFPGKLAQVAAWNRVLTAAEIANLAAGYAPDLAAASGLQFYFKGNTSSLTAAPGGLGSADGTSSSTGVGNGPSIIYP